MTRVRKPWMAVLIGALLVGTLVGVVWARPHDRPQAQDTTRKVVVGGGDFLPMNETTDYTTTGGWVRCDGATCYFAAPVVFPCLSAVTVERIKLHVYDPDAGGYAAAQMRRLNPNNGTTRTIGHVDSLTVDPTAKPETVTSPDINKVVWPSQKGFVWLFIGMAPNTRVYGITVEYHRNG